MCQTRITGRLRVERGRHSSRASSNIRQIWVLQVGPVRPIYLCLRELHRCNGVVAVEGKVDESFGEVVKSWLAAGVEQNNALHRIGDIVLHLGKLLGWSRYVVH